MNLSMEDGVDVHSSLESNLANRAGYFQQDMVGGQMLHGSVVPIALVNNRPADASRFTQEHFATMPLGKWAKIMPVDNQCFTPRTGHDCILVKDRIYLFGGTDDDDRKNDLHEYDIFQNRWTLMPANGKLPMPRSGAKGVFYDEKLYFFGGYQKKSGNFYRDLFYYDLSSQQWHDVPQAIMQGEIPSQRTDHTVVLWDGRLYVYGGYDGKKRFGDLYKCCIKNKKYKWKEIHAEGALPLNRFGHSAVVY